jgi:predicted porin
MKKTQQATNSSEKALDRDTITYGISAPVGKAVLFAQYGTGDNVTTGTTGASADLKAYQVGARYFLSKRTFGYIATGNVKHEVSATNKNDYSETVVGLLHAF